MSILAKEAAALRQVAARLEDAAVDAPRSAKDLLRRFGPQALNYMQCIDLHIANDPGFVECCVKNAGIALGVEIGKKLRAEFKGLSKPDYYGVTTPPYFDRKAEYTAQVYVFTPAEIEELLQKAWHAGRESL